MPRFCIEVVKNFLQLLVHRGLQKDMRVKVGRKIFSVLIYTKYVCFLVSLHDRSYILLYKMLIPPPALILYL